MKLKGLIYRTFKEITEDRFFLQQYGKFQHQFIGLELAGLVPIRIPVCLQFAVGLFVLPVGVIQYVKIVEEAVYEDVKNVD